MFTFKGRSPLVAVGIMLAVKKRQKPCSIRTEPQNLDRDHGTVGSFPPDLEVSMRTKIELEREEKVLLRKKQLASLMMGENDYRRN